MSDPLSFFMDIFSKIIVKMTSGINKIFQSAIWSFFPPAWQGTLNKYGTYVLLGVVALGISGFIGIHFLIDWGKTDGLCVDPKDGTVVKNQFNEGIKSDAPDCPYNIPEGICEDPKTSRIYINDLGQQLTSDNPDCPSYTPPPPPPKVEPTQPEVVEEAAGEEKASVEEITPVKTPEETSYTDFRNKLKTQIGGRRKRRKKNIPKNRWDIYKKYHKYW
jgi:hypothetical protein